MVNPILTLATIALVCLTTCAYAAHSQQLYLEETFREPKNIVFGAHFGGSSHIVWPLILLEELGERGHNVSYITKDDTLRFAKPFKNIKAISIGAAAEFDRFKLTGKLKGSKDQSKVIGSVQKMIMDTYDQDYKNMVKQFKEIKADLAVCDHFMDICIDAAITEGTPFVISTTSEFTQETAAPYINNNILSLEDPTTEHQSIKTRFENKFIVPAKSMIKKWNSSKDMKAIKEAAGVYIPSENPSKKFKDALKIVNNVIGMTPARPMGPLAETIGPILPKTYQPLTEDLENYLNAHERVAYIGFGQTIVPSSKNIELILTGLIESIEAGYLDSFLWAIVGADGRFPESITSRSGITYSVKDMFENKNPHVRMVDWAPQTAILYHPSTKLFVSHGGLTSWQESMYVGVRMIMFPFLGDQPPNALTVERNQLGGILKADATIAEATDLFQRITADKDGQIAKNVKRFQALVQIRARNAAIRGADVLEEVVFVNKDGKPTHRYPASRNMSFIKAHNIDLYFVLISVISVFVLAMGGLAHFGLNYYISYQLRSKIEKKIKNN